jgi:hypothetical protein
MATRRAIRGVLANFLGTYMSRYSDFDGYWLFGFLIGGPAELRIDLLAPPVGVPGTPLDTAVRSAAVKFEDQMQKAGLTRPQIRDAWLVLRKLPGSVAGSVNGHPCIGHRLLFSAGAVTDDGRRYGREQDVFVAPHNAEVELRSAWAAQRGDAADPLARAADLGR